MGLKWSEKRLEKELKGYDPELYVLKTPRGMLQVYRQPKDKNEFHLIPDESGSVSTPMLVLCLTDNWKLDGDPVDHGIEPVMEMIRMMDSWREPDAYGRMLKQREREKEAKDQNFRNDIRARAADLRKDFAKATNDINTSTL